MILTNPPFGTKGANQAPDRDDFTIATSNKQLNFLQHVLTILKPGGRAAVVLPDNCLFADQAGEVFKILMRGLRPAHGPAPARAAPSRPYSQGVKTNVIFFTKGDPTETRLDLRRPHQRPRHHQEGPAAHAGALRRVREVLRRRPERPERSAKPADSKEDRWRSFSHRRGQGARLQARRLQVAEGGVAGGLDDLPNPRSWRPTPSRSLRRRSTS